MEFWLIVWSGGAAATCTLVLLRYAYFVRRWPDFGDVRAIALVSALWPIFWPIALVVAFCLFLATALGIIPEDGGGDA